MNSAPLTKVGGTLTNIVCFTEKQYGLARQNAPVIVTTVVPVGDQSTHMICPHCCSEITTITQMKPGIVAYISGIIIAMMG